MESLIGLVLQPLPLHSITLEEQIPPIRGDFGMQKPLWALTGEQMGSWWFSITWRRSGFIWLRMAQSSGMGGGDGGVLCLAS